MPTHADIVLDVSAMFSEAIGSSGIQKTEIDNLHPQITDITKGLNDLRRLGLLPFQDLPSHDESAAKIVAKSREIRDRFDSVLLLGIGGSALGARFLVESLGQQAKPRLIFCDQVDPVVWKKVSEELDWQKTLTVVISKSGKTTETLAAFMFFRQFSKDCLIITDPQEGPLRKMAMENGIGSFEIPPGVGGRYSVLSPAGLFPAALAGVDIQELLAGARRMDERCKNLDPWFNPAWMSAALNYLSDIKRRRKIRVIMPYGERLRSYAPWFAQLWAESLGKNMTLKGKKSALGTTPVCSVGPQDQHSQLQLYLEGPDDKTVTFLGNESEKGDLKLPDGLPHISETRNLVGRSVHELLQIGRKATERALTEVGRPNQTILLKEINPHAIGQLLFMAELETVYAGELYNVNPFDQPAVEKIKRNIQVYLSGKISEKKNRSYLI